jgi:hypothetical protein
MDPVPGHGVEKMKYQDVDLDSFGTKVVIYENPPFKGEAGIDFLNHFFGDDNVDTAIVILPDHYRGHQTSTRGKKTINPFFHCTTHKVFPPNSFEPAEGKNVEVLISIQKWVRRDYVRPEFPLQFKAVGKYNIDKGIKMYVKKLNPLARRKGRDLVYITRSPTNRGDENGLPILISKERPTPRFRMRLRANVRMINARCFQTSNTSSERLFRAGNFNNAAIDLYNEGKLL